MNAGQRAWVALLAGTLLVDCGAERLSVVIPGAGKAVEYPDSDWEPGDPIPGWEDGDCAGLLDGADSTEWDVPTPYQTLAWLQSGQVRIMAHRVDCNEFDCGEGGSGLPNWSVYLISDYDPHGARAVGRYPFGADDPFTSFTADAPSGWIVASPGNQYNNAAVEVCIDRAQPDLLSLTAVATVEDGVAGLDGGWQQYLLFGVRVEVTFEDHAGFQYVEGESVPYTTEPRWTYVDPVYDDAWPWDLITDPAVREEVYWRYLPYNLMEGG